MSIRVGQGFDVHAFDKTVDKSGQSTVVLGGVSIPHTYPLLAHSDGDVLVHAICDALLGALALGDIGHHFPDTDPRYANVSSIELLAHCIELVASKGFVLENLDSTIIAQTPRMAPFILAMREQLASVFKTELGQISVKATTTEKLGFTGRGDGIACQSVVLLTRSTEEL